MARTFFWNRPSNAKQRSRPVEAGYYHRELAGVNDFLGISVNEFNTL
jgi:hypothetical protein